jgi:hypothetical protein
VTPIWAYDPPTDEELSGWWESLSREERLEQLRKLDTIEHAEPLVGWPTVLYLLDGRDLVVAYPNGNEINVRIGPLHYGIQLQPERIQDFAPRSEEWKWGLGGLGAGVLVGIVIYGLLT